MVLFVPMVKHSLQVTKLYSYRVPSIEVILQGKRGSLEENCASRKNFLKRKTFLVNS